MDRIHVKAAPNRPTRTLELGLRDDGSKWRMQVRAGSEFLAEGLEASRIRDAVKAQGLGADIKIVDVAPPPEPVPEDGAAAQDPIEPPASTTSSSSSRKRARSS